jgi:hypothetical protein
MRRLIAGILAPLIAITGFYLWGRSHPHTVSRSVEIAAPASRVWDVLSDLHAYPHWNPSLTAVSGHLTQGAALTVRVHSGSGSSTLHRTVQGADPGRELVWKGAYQDIPILGEEERRFTITRVDADHVRFTQAATYRGIVIPAVHGVLDKGAVDIDAMNAALKKRAESHK